MIEVRPDDVRALGGRLNHTATRLGRHGLRSLADGLGTDPAAAVVADALRHAEDDWSTQRRVIVAFLESSGRAAMQAADAYRGLETRIGRACDAVSAR